MRIVLAAFLLAAVSLAADLDRDSIDDMFEQQLLERFAPRFHVSEADCDGLPARFSPNEPEPRATARDGTIYAQASPHPAGVELHYYHLWTNDCGPSGHAFDVEHVSGLVRSGGLRSEPQEWFALYWYSAAHEGTVCDTSHATRASAIDAVAHGPRVWISAGKHASYLDPGKCAAGCGGDRCELRKPLAVPGIINVGEPGRALNGAIWIDSASWTLKAKLQTDFSDEVLAVVSRSPAAEIARLREAPAGFQSTIASTAATAQMLQKGAGSTQAALARSEQETSSAIGSGFKETGRSLVKTKNAIVNWFRDRHARR